MPHRSRTKSGMGGSGAGGAADAAAASEDATHQAAQAVRGPWADPADAVVAHLGLVEHEAAPVSPQLDDEALPTDGLAPVGLQLPHVERDDPGAQALPVRRDETQPEGTQLAGLEGDRAE